MSNAQLLADLVYFHVRKYTAFMSLYHFLLFLNSGNTNAIHILYLTSKFKWNSKLPGFFLFIFNGILNYVIVIILTEWFQPIGNACWFVRIAVALIAAHSLKELFANVWLNNELGKYAIRIFIFISNSGTSSHRRWTEVAAYFPLLILFGYWHRSLRFTRPTFLFASF